MLRCGSVFAANCAVAVTGRRMSRVLNQPSVRRRLVVMSSVSTTTASTSLAAMRNDLAWATAAPPDGSKRKPVVPESVATREFKNACNPRSVLMLPMPSAPSNPS